MTRSWNYWHRYREGPPESNAQVKQAEVEVKVKQGSDSLYLNLSLSLNLLRVGAFFNILLDGVIDSMIADCQCPQHLSLLHTQISALSTFPN